MGRMHIALLALCAAVPAAAHHLSNGAGGGVVVPSLAHGQMAVYARHYDEIMRLATARLPGEEQFRRIVNFARIQKAWCLWGFAPRAISDEDSPFNECSHAYLAAARALLDDMRASEDAAPAAAALGARVDDELARAGASAICGFSGENFNTADRIAPDWRGIPRHAPTLAAAAGLLALACGVGMALTRLGGTIHRP